MHCDIFVRTAPSALNWCGQVMFTCRSDDDDVVLYYYIGERLKLKEETENMGVCTKEREGQRYS